MQLQLPQPDGRAPPQTQTGPDPAAAHDNAPATRVPAMAGSRWVPAQWSELPGWGLDPLDDVWPALLRNCTRPQADWAAACTEMQGLAQASTAPRQLWVESRLRPYRLTTADGQAKGLLTAYYEPLLLASRLPRAGFEIPLYQPPPVLPTTAHWHSRREIETKPEALTVLRGLEIAYLSDPIDAMILHIQGSGRLQVQEPDGRMSLVRLSFAGSNRHPYHSIGRWLLDRNLTRDVSWPGIKAWLTANPQQRDELLWANPRYVFFNETALSDPDRGPKGAQGLELTAGRSVAIDPQSLPYGTPLWLVSDGAHPLRKLVLAQDTGSAIVGAVRADYFVGGGADAGQVAGKLRQDLWLWALWPR